LENILTSHYSTVLACVTFWHTKTCLLSAMVSYLT